MDSQPVEPIWLTLKKAGYTEQAKRMQNRFELRRLEKKARALVEKMKRS